MNTSFRFPITCFCQILTLAALSGSALGLTPVSDDFNDNSLDLSKWESFSDGGAISESSGRINYTVGSPGVAGDYAELACNSSPGSSENWQVIVDVTNTTTPASLGQISSVGIQIYNAADLNDAVFLELYSSALDQTPYRRGFVSGLITNGIDVPASDIDTGNLPGQTTGSLRIAYNGTTKVLTTYYDATGSGNGFQWVQLSSYGLNNSGGANGTTNWGAMSSGFAVSIYGYSEAMTITSGQVTLDNFSLSANNLVPEITVEQPAGAALVDGSSSVAFEATSAGTPVVKTFTIRNDGSASLTGLSLSKVGTNAANFSLGSLGATSLAAGASTTFTVTCSPQAGAAQTATLRIASNDADENPFDINLSARVVAINGDDFNDNSKNNSKWGSDITFGTGGTLAETNSRLEYTSNTASGDHGIYRPWILNQATYNSDWELIMDVSNSISLPPGLPFRDTGIGIEIFPPATDLQSFFTEMNASAWETGSFHGFVSGQGEDEFAVNDQELSSAGVNGSIRIVFNSTTKVFNTYCDTDGSANGYAWTLLATFGITGSGGETNADWEMSGSQSFQIAVYGFVNGSIVTSGQLHADNFQITTPPPTPLQSWQLAKFGNMGSPEAALDFDADNDGLLSLLEYAFKLEPKVPGTPVLTTLTGTSGLPRITPVGSGPTQRLRLEYVRMKTSSNPGITYTPQFSSNLQGSGPGGWNNASGPETVQSIDIQWERVVIEDTAGTGLPGRFGRVLVTAP